MNLASLLGGSLGQVFKDVVSTFKLPPEKAAEMQAAIDQHAHEVQMKEFELQIKATEIAAKEIETASENIRAEAQSGDKYTSRARPSFLYIVYVVITFNFIVVPLIQMIKGIALQPLQLPEDMYWLFGAGYLGYTGFRSLDKSGFKWGKQ